MGEVIEQRCGHLGVAEDGGPFAEAEVGGDDDAGALIELTQQMEQQCPARCAERQTAQLIEDHQIDANQAFGDLSGLALGLFLLQRVDEFDRGAEPNLPSVMLDGLNAEGGGQVGFARSLSAEPSLLLAPSRHSHR